LTSTSLTPTSVHDTPLSYVLDTHMTPIDTYPHSLAEYPEWELA